METLRQFNADNDDYIGYTAAIVECTGNSQVIPTSSILTFPAGDNYGSCFIYRTNSRSPTKMFIMANSFPQRLLHVVTQQLDALGYTWVEGELGGAMAGPAVPYASPYKTALAELLQQGFEAGLFQQARDLDNFKAVYGRARMLMINAPLEDGTLNLGDLEPYFATLAVGITASLVVLLAEYLRYHCRRCFIVA
ncbi:hypothetical protein HPB48_021633 [Haemaphysalis longicornis]|uniref:Uncharacterized protein n=1 Tax=Haemaphysalis longicornis TaxID=44386 RepID=A0A9J6GV50_HAELO|nr:hypothetical protein HPB48_021633 [Haemaphysalis longicornis]